jgi:hypothetical protein
VRQARRRRVDAAAVAAAAVVGHHLGVAHPGQALRLVDGVVQEAQAVHQAELGRVGAGVDAPVGQGADALLRQVAALGDHRHELAVEAVHHALQDSPLLVGHGPRRVADVLVRPRLDRLAAHAHQGAQAAGVVQAHDDADAARHRGRVGQHAVAAHRQVVAAAGADVHHAGHHRLAGAAAEAAQLLVHDLAGRHAAARRVQPQHHRLDLAVLRRRVEALMELGHGVVAAGAEEGARLRVQDQALDVDEGDLVEGQEVVGVADGRLLDGAVDVGRDQRHAVETAARREQQRHQQPARHERASCLGSGRRHNRTRPGGQAGPGAV